MKAVAANKVHKPDRASLQAASVPPKAAPRKKTVGMPRMRKVHQPAGIHHSNSRVRNAHRPAVPPDWTTSTTAATAGA